MPPHALRSLLAPRDLYRLGRDTFARYGRLGGSQFAAAISYRALFSLVPLATFAGMVLATVLEGNDGARQSVVDAISDRFQLSQSGTVDLDRLTSVTG